MGVELLPKFITRKGNPEIPFGQKYEEFSPKGVVVSGYVLHRTNFPCIDVMLGSLRDGIERKTRFEVDSGTFVTVLMPKDAKHLFKTATNIEKDYILQFNGTRVEGRFLDTEIWLNGKYLSEDVLLAIRLRVFAPEYVTNHRYSSLLGLDALGQFNKLEIDLADGKVVFRAKDSDNVKAYRKIL